MYMWEGERKKSNSMYVCLCVCVEGEMNKMGRTRGE